MKIKYLIFLFSFLLLNVIYSQQIDLSKEYSMSEFRKGIIAFHNGEYELAITFFTKALSYKFDNNLASYFLGESYRKAGYEKNALSVWNNLLAMGFEDRTLKLKISELYFSKGNLSQINITKSFLIKKDLRGFIDPKTPPLFIKPTQIAISKDNHYFIPCFLSGYVIEMDPNFHIIKNHFPIGTKLERPFGVAVDRDSNIYVSDFKNNSVIKFDKFGLVKGTIGYKGIGDSSLIGPEYIILDDEENLYVTDSGNAKINKYTKEGIFLFSFGNKTDSGEKIKKPAGLFFNKNSIYVCDKDGNKIFVFDKNGNFFESFGENILNKPYQITIDKYQRFIIICETDIWIYEKNNDIWYKLDEIGNRLKKGISIVTDKENNLLLTDFNDARIIALSPERERYTNLNVTIERVYSYKFPEVFLSMTIRKDDLSTPTGITPYNITVYENGKAIDGISSELTKSYNSYNDIVILIDSNTAMKKYQSSIKLLVERWLKSKNEATKIAIATIANDDILFLTDFSSTNLSHLDAIDKLKFYNYTDKGSAIKSTVYKLLSRFSKKSIIFLTNANETGNDFNKFSIENSLDLAKNNDIPFYTIYFSNGTLSTVIDFISKKSGGASYYVNRDSATYSLISEIQNRKSNEMIFSYRTKTLSRFGEEPITVTAEVNYSGMKGSAKTVYFPVRQ